MNAPEPTDRPLIPTHLLALLVGSIALAALGSQASAASRSPPASLAAAATPDGLWSVGQLPAPPAIFTRPAALHLNHADTSVSSNAR